MMRPPFSSRLGGAQGETVAARWTVQPEVLAIEERLPRLGDCSDARSNETKQRDDAKEILSSESFTWIPKT